MFNVRIEEHNESLTLRLPRRPLRLIGQVGGPAVVFTAVILLVIWQSRGWLCPVIGFGLVFGCILAFLYLTTAPRLLTATTVCITRDSIDVEKQRLGKRPTRRSHIITGKSRAYKWYGLQRVGSDSSPQPQGIEIGTQWDNVERSVDESVNDAVPRFGWSLRESEMDALIDRINTFLDRVRRT